MYSRKIVEQRVSQLADTQSLRLVRYDLHRVDTMVERLDSIVNTDGELKRALTVQEKEFIRNERVYCAIDFTYWLERYVKAIQDQGGLDRVQPWESQLILLRHIALLEEEMVEKSSKGESVDGILIVLHKARQLGATLIGRALTVHRLITVKHIRAMAASLDDDKILELYDRDKTIIDNLPWWLRPSLGFDEKAQHIYFDKLASRVIYQTGNQKFGVGQGRQFDLGHLTECASWPYPDVIEHDYFPTIPQSLRAMVLLESTAQGRRNWWHELCLRVRSHQTRRWKFVFIPWYVEEKKYHATPPDDWKPSDVAMKHAQMVYETSTEFVGKPLFLSRGQLFWWQSTREEYQSADNLNLFFTNYPSTPLESFQHTQRSAFSASTLETLRNGTKPGVAYEIKDAA